MSQKTKYIFDGIKRVINNKFNVLVSGENGTGKKQMTPVQNFGSCLTMKESGT